MLIIEINSYEIAQLSLQKSLKPNNMCWERRPFFGNIILYLYNYPAWLGILGMVHYNYVSYKEKQEKSKILASRRNIKRRLSCIIAANKK